MFTEAAKNLFAVPLLSHKKRETKQQEASPCCCYELTTNVRPHLMFCVCCPAEFDAVHRQRFAGGRGEGARGGEGAVHGGELSSCVHAQEHAGAAGTSTCTGFPQGLNPLVVFSSTRKVYVFLGQNFKYKVFFFQRFGLFRHFCRFSLCFFVTFFVVFVTFLCVLEAFLTFLKISWRFWHIFPFFSSLFPNFLSIFFVCAFWRLLFFPQRFCITQIHWK